MSLTPEDQSPVSVILATAMSLPPTYTPVKVCVCLWGLWSSPPPQVSWKRIGKGSVGAVAVETSLYLEKPGERPSGGCFSSISILISSLNLSPGEKNQSKFIEQDTSEIQRLIRQGPLYREARDMTSARGWEPARC